MVLKNKKELENFILKMDLCIDKLIKYLNEYGLTGVSIDDFANKIDEIQVFYEDEFSTKTEDIQRELQLGFWAFFSRLLMDKLGGELIIASKTDYCAGTPQLINFGNRFDKKGKKKWIGIAVDSWFVGVTKKKC
jgi:hypothetical protein